MVCSPFHWLNAKWSAVRHREGNLVSKCIRVSHVKTGGYYLYFRLIWVVCYWYLNFEAGDKFKVRINVCAFNHFQAVLVSRLVTNVERWLFLYNKWNPIKLIYLPPANEVWGKVIFSEVCVKNSVHGGVLVSQHALQVVSQHALQVSRPTQFRGMWPGGGLQTHTQGRSWGGSGWEVFRPTPGGSVPGGTAPKGEMPGPRGGCVETPRMATAAGGTHPTGMHSCFT